MPLSLHCECGQVQGRVDTGQAYVRAACYCSDCQAYARFLGRPAIIDADGGTDIVAMNPSAVHITSGHQHIACMSFSGKGLLRWYADCCRTPLGNTSRDAMVSYVGMLAYNLATPSAVNEAFGSKGRPPPNGGFATELLETTPLAFLLDRLGSVREFFAARVRKQRPSLFFDADGQPIRSPEVLSAAQRAELYAVT